MAPYILRRPSALGTPMHRAREGGFTAPPFLQARQARQFDGDTTFDSLHGRPAALAVPSHTPGSTAYVFAKLGAVFTGDALVTHDGVTGHRGPGIVCRAFTSDSATALASLDRLADLPGHGEPFAQGITSAAARRWNTAPPDLGHRAAVPGTERCGRATQLRRARDPASGHNLFRMSVAPKRLAASGMPICAMINIR